VSSLEVKPVQEFGDYWSAALFIEGVQTTFSCQHNHKTKFAAAKCMAKMMANARRYLWHPTFRERIVDTSDWGQDDTRPLIEWEITIDGLPRTTRFRFGA